MGPGVQRPAGRSPGRARRIGVASRSLPLSPPCRVGKPHRLHGDLHGSPPDPAEPSGSLRDDLGFGGLSSGGRATEDIGDSLSAHGSESRPASDRASQGTLMDGQSGRPARGRAGRLPRALVSAIVDGIRRESSARSILTPDVPQRARCRSGSTAVPPPAVPSAVTCPSPTDLISRVWPRHASTQRRSCRRRSG
jgi:hypothetical protein